MALSLPVESSWRMVEGDHDSFDTSVVPGPFGLSQESSSGGPFSGAPDAGSNSNSSPPSQQSLSPSAARPRWGLGTQTSSGGAGGSAFSSQGDGPGLGSDSGGGGGDSFAGSQDDDIVSFLRKAENDERVLLRSPFQPSLPSSVRQSPLSVAGGSSAGRAAAQSRLDRTAHRTPEPELRMPTMDMDGSLHADGTGLGGAAGWRQRGTALGAFRVSDTGSPAQRHRRGMDGLLGRFRGGSAVLGKRNDRQTGPSASALTAGGGAGHAASVDAAAAAWRPALLFLVSLVAAACGAALFAAGSGPMSGSSATAAATSASLHGLCFSAAGMACAIPGVPQLGRFFCPATADASLPAPPLALPGRDRHTDAARDGNYWTIRDRFNNDRNAHGAAAQADAEYGGEAAEPGAGDAGAVVVGHRPAPASLVHSAGELMRVQMQLAVAMREHVLASRRSSGPASRSDSSKAVARANAVPPAQDAWLVPRARTKRLRTAAQIEQARDGSPDQRPLAATLLLVELDAYLDDARRVSQALARLQTRAAAAAADTLAYSSRRTLAKLRRLASVAVQKTPPLPQAPAGWLARLIAALGSASPHGAAARAQQRARLVDAYRHHAEALLAKTHDRAGDVEAVLAALEAAGHHLTRVQSYVTARRDGLVGGGTAGAAGPGSRSVSAVAEEGGLLTWLWGLVFGHPQPGGAGGPDAPSTRPAPVRMSKAARAWSEFADEVQQLRTDHDAAVVRAGDALDALAAVQEALGALSAQFGGDGAAADEAADLDMRLHVDIVEAAVEDLEALGR